MDTKLATQQFRLQEWAGIFKDRKNSGLKVDEYCQLHHISRDAYYYWLRKVKTAALTQAGFVELPVYNKKHTSNPTFIPQMSIRLGTAEICVNNDTPSELITRVLGVIRHAQ